MRVASLVLALAVTTLLSGCAAAVEVANNQKDAAMEAATKAEISTAVIALLQHQVATGDFSIPGPDKFAELGIAQPVATPDLAFHAYTASAFCADGTASSGATFYEIAGQSLQPGKCPAAQ